MRKAIPLDDFRSDEIKKLTKEFETKKIGNLFIEKEEDAGTGETVFCAKLKEKEDFKISAKSADAYHAKDKLLPKLRDYLRNHGIQNMFPVTGGVEIAMHA